MGGQFLQILRHQKFEMHSYFCAGISNGVAVRVDDVEAAAGGVGAADGAAIGVANKATEKICGIETALSDTT